MGKVEICVRYKENENRRGGGFRWEAVGVQELEHRYVWWLKLLYLLLQQHTDGLFRAQAGQGYFKGLRLHSIVLVAPFVSIVPFLASGDDPPVFLSIPFPFLGREPSSVLDVLHPHTPNTTQSLWAPRICLSCPASKVLSFFTALFNLIILFK